MTQFTDALPQMISEAVAYCPDSQTQFIMKRIGLRSETNCYPEHVLHNSLESAFDAVLNNVGYSLSFSLT